VHDAPIALIGPGHGLGGSPLIPSARRAMGTAAGRRRHVTAGGHEREAAVLQAVARSGTHRPNARSREGLEALYRRVVPARRRGRRAGAAGREISQRGLAGSDAQCVEAIDPSAVSRNVAATSR